MSDIKQESLKLHEEFKGKLEIKSKVPIKTKEDLALAYSPGVAEPCNEIYKNKENVYKYTTKGNMLAIVTDGTAVLGLGDIGPEAALPVIEGKAILLKEFANVDAFPICLDSKDEDDIIKTCKLLAPGLGAIQLEDIAAPKCVTIERTLIKELDIPVFHDDQHGTAIVTTAALLNSCRLTGKKIEDLEVVVSGTGAAGSSICNMLKQVGVKKIYAYNRKGIVTKEKYDRYRFLVKEMLDNNTIDSPDTIGNDTLEDLLKNKDVFIGVSVANLVTKKMVASMNKNPFIFAMANPNPEIMPEDAMSAGAKIIGTGRSDFPNQINNVLAFPGIFRGALDCNAKKINEEMKLAAAKAIANLLTNEELKEDYIIPSPFDRRVVDVVKEAVIEAAIKTNVIR